MVLLMLTGILIVTLAASTIVESGIKMGRLQIESTKAYYAAEAGAEYAIWVQRYNSSNLPLNSSLTYDDANYEALYGTGVGVKDFFYQNTFSNGATVDVLYASSSTATTFDSRGIYNNTSRTVRVASPK